MDGMFINVSATGAVMLMSEAGSTVADSATDGEVVINGTDVMTAVGDTFDLANVAFSNIVKNPVLILFLGATLVGVGVGVFRKLRRAV